MDVPKEAGNKQKKWSDVAFLQRDLSDYRYQWKAPQRDDTDAGARQGAVGEEEGTEEPWGQYQSGSSNTTADSLVLQKVLIRSKLQISYQGICSKPPLPNSCQTNRRYLNTS